MRRRPILSFVAVLAVSAGVLGAAIAVAPVAERGVRVETGSLAPPPAPATTHEAFDRLFNEGVAYLRAGRAHEASVVFEAAAGLRPNVPEAFVNLGFAQVAQGRFDEARAAFDRALVLERRQINAYYGLAMALEGLGDLEGAVGAMRTFVHLAPEGREDFRRRADAALWEWTDALDRRMAARDDG